MDRKHKTVDCVTWQVEYTSHRKDLTPGDSHYTSCIDHSLTWTHDRSATYSTYSKLVSASSTIDNTETDMVHLWIAMEKKDP